MMNETTNPNMSELIANTPTPPYFAVIFTSCRREGDKGYSAMAKKMVELASIQTGFLGIESAREEVGITVSYWDNLASIKNWKANVDHLEAQKLGHTLWYDAFKVRVCKVERDYSTEVR